MKHYKRCQMKPLQLTPNNEDFCLESYMDVPLYTPRQVYATEKTWFDNGNQSYGLMQQAAWQIAQFIHKNHTSSPNLNTWVWVGSGNNGGDGWLVASYLHQLGADVTVVDVAQAATPDSKSAKQDALKQDITVLSLSELGFSKLDFSDSGISELHLSDQGNNTAYLKADVFVDALFGIGLDRAPKKDYAKAISYINQTKSFKGESLSVVSVDVPSGLVASTGEVFEGCAIKADVTVCLVARKLGLHIKDGVDYVGQVVDVPLIPSVLSENPVAWLQYCANPMPKRENNSYKGSFGHALIIGGNRVDGSQGMGGAAILSASTALATGVGKLTVACHDAFHGSLITSLPNAMSIDLHDSEGVKSLINQCNTVAMGMGLGRDQKSFELFSDYLQAVIDAEVDLIIDADGLYHLATIAKQNPDLTNELINHAKDHEVWYTPHSGEAARLLDVETKEVESDRMKSIKQLVNKYKGNWLLKGAGSIVMENGTCYVCAAGNPGMATAGMGDVLSGLAAGLLAQSSLPKICRSLRQTVMVHALAGDALEEEVGIWALQSSDMPSAVGDVMKKLSEFETYSSQY